MAATYRYTGANAVILFNGVTVSNDYTDLMIQYTLRTEDKTAGNDTAQSVNPTIKEGKAQLKRLDIGETDGGVAAALKIGAVGTLEVRPKGTATGLPVQSFPAIVVGFKFTEIFNKNTLMEIDLIKNGPMIRDVGSVQ